MRLKKSWLWLLAASIGLSLALPLALGGWGQFQLLGRLSWWAALLFALLMVVSWWFNSWRIRMLLRVGGQRMSWREAVLTTSSAEFAGVATPGGVGMPATYIFLFHRLGVGVPAAAGLEGLIVVTDLVFYVTVMRPAASSCCSRPAPNLMCCTWWRWSCRRCSEPRRSSGASGATIAGICIPPWPPDGQGVPAGLGTVTAWAGPRSNLFGPCASYRKCHGPSIWPSI